MSVQFEKREEAPPPIQRPAWHDEPHPFLERDQLLSTEARLAWGNTNGIVYVDDQGQRAKAELEESFGSYRFHHWDVHELGDEVEAVPLHEVIDILNALRHRLHQGRPAPVRADHRGRRGRRAGPSPCESEHLRKLHDQYQGQVEGLMIDRMDKNQDIVTKFLNEEDFNVSVGALAKLLYEEIRNAG